MHPPLGSWWFEIHRPELEPMRVAVSNRQLRLFDAGLVAGHPMALATLINWHDIEDTYEDLLLVDLDPEPSHDPGEMFSVLGRVGGWESLIVNAKFTSDRIILATSSGFEARTLEGEILWSNSTDRKDSPFVLTDTELIVLQAGFVDPNFQPVLEYATYKLATGDFLSERTIQLDARFGGGFCSVADWTGTGLVCDESYGGPFTVDLATGHVETIADLDDGMPVVLGR